MSLSFLFAKQEKPLVDTLPMENVKYGLLGVNPYGQPDRKRTFFWWLRREEFLFKNINHKTRGGIGALFLFLNFFLLTIKIFPSLTFWYATKCSEACLPPAPPGRARFSSSSLRTWVECSIASQNHAPTARNKNICLWEILLRKLPFRDRLPFAITEWACSRKPHIPNTNIFIFKSPGTNLARRKASKKYF